MSWRSWFICYDGSASGALRERKRAPCSLGRTERCGILLDRRDLGQNSAQADLKHAQRLCHRVVLQIEGHDARCNCGSAIDRWEARTRLERVAQNTAPARCLPGFDSATDEGGQDIRGFEEVGGEIVRRSLVFRLEGLDEQSVIGIRILRLIAVYG